MGQCSYEKEHIYRAGNVVIGEDELVSRKQLLESKFYKELISRDKNMGQ